jgi:hypothetical protein
VGEALDELRAERFVVLHDFEQPSDTRNQRPFRHDRVWIVGRSYLAAWIRAQHNETAEFEAIARYADQL